MKPDRPTESLDETRLRARFQELRKSDQRGVPEFRSMWGAPRPARSPWRVLAPAASLAAAAMVVLWCGSQTALESASAPQAVEPPAQPPAGGAAPAAPGAAPAGGDVAFDLAPLDFLLDVPGSAPRAVRTSFDTNPLQGW